jgi:phosphoglycolate phosphatase-like HAD superfamily hydrolase
MKALALDFDGVLSDSAREAFAVALRTYAALAPRSRLAAASDAPDPQKHPALYAAFLDLMPLGNRAEDYAVALLSIDADTALRDQTAYDAYYAAQEIPFLRAFHHRFYEERRAFAARDREGWLRLLPPFAPLLELLRRRAGAAVYAIATAKDAATVARLLERYGVADLFDPRWILDKEIGSEKRLHLRALADGLGVALSDITFVDDKLNHLEAVRPLGVRCALAGWGYNGERERLQAGAAGIPVCTLANAEAFLFPATAPGPAGVR